MRPLEENFRILRVRVEAHKPAPSLIAVSSAIRGDGATYVACGLARAFAESGRRTLIIDANVANPGVADELGLRAVGPGGGLGSVRASVDIPRLYVVPRASPDADSPLGKGDTQELLEAVREEYDVAIIDTAAIPTCSVAMQLATMADGLLLAVRLGRRRSPADDELMQLLGDNKANLLGVVPTHARGRRSGTPSDTAAASTTEPPRNVFARAQAGR